MEQQINQLLYWQEEAERLRYDISTQKQKAQQQEQAWREREAFLLDCIEGQRGADGAATAAEKGKAADMPNPISPIITSPAMSPGIAPPAKKAEVRESSATPSTAVKTDLDANEEGIVTQKNETGLVVVKAGLPSKLLERLLDPAFHDSHFMQTFMMTYKGFVDSAAILAQVETIATLPQDKNSTPSILKAANVLKYWIENYFSDFTQDPLLMQKVKDIAIKITNPKLGQMLQALIAKKEAAGPDAVVQSPANDQAVFPKPILPKTLSKNTFRGDPFTSPNLATATFIAAPSMSDMKVGLKFKLADLDPLEVARQITLIEYDLFSRIKVTFFNASLENLLVYVG